MKNHTFLTALLALAFVLGGSGPIDLTPSAEAATSAEKRKTRKFKKDARKFRKQAQMLRRQLAAALLPDPVPPFIEMVTVGNPGNGNDPEDGNINDFGTKQNFGAVSATFRVASP